MNRLNQLGLPDKQTKAFLARTGHFHVREPVFGVESDLVRRGVLVVFNSYRRGTVRAEPGAWPDIYAVVLSVSNGDTGFLNYLLDWLALPIQALYLRGKPQLNRTAVVLQGIEGSGKNTLFEIMSWLYGASNCVTLSQKNIDSQFTAQLRNKLFALCNEVMTSTNKSAETANQLKAWIADDVISLEAKHVDAENARNFVNLIFASNDETPVIISMTDRRYSVKRATRKLPDEIAERVKADLQGDQRQLSAFFSHLLRRNVAMKVGEIYATDERKAIQQTSSSSEDRFCREVAEDGWYAVSVPWVEASNVGRATHHDGFIPFGTLAEVYAAYCKRFGLKACGDTKLVQALKRAVPAARPGTPRLGQNKVKTRGYWDVPLDVPDTSKGAGSNTSGKVLTLPRRDSTLSGTACIREAQP
jgi:phage/plasmid-associated DNA primase